VDRLQELEFFVRVAEGGSFTAAAKRLGVQQPTVSKAIAALEERLGARLLNRNPGGLSVTDAGAEYLEHARALLDLYEAGLSTARRHSGELEGVIHVTSSTAFGRLKLGQRILEFLNTHPKVQIHATIHDGDVDLVAEGLDVAIRIGQLGDSALVARRIGTSRRVTVATPAYLARAGVPQAPEDLTDHECIVYTHLRRGRRWYFEGPHGPMEVGATGRLQTDSSETALDAVLSGFGLGHFPSWLCAEALRTGVVREVLANFPSEAMPIHAVFPERRLITRRARSFVDYLEDSFRSDPDLSREAPDPRDAIPDRNSHHPVVSVENRAPLRQSDLRKRSS
jgi:molybdate transport repressor ModE-like protein